jgi:hypothetical protein
MWPGAGGLDTLMLSDVWIHQFCHCYQHHGCSVTGPFALTCNLVLVYDLELDSNFVILTRQCHKKE